MVEPSSSESSSESVVESSEPLPEGELLISKGDTLWSIASRYKDSEHSMSQVMLAFQRTNPDAFNDSNINNMKLGAVLRVPNEYEMDAVDQQEAYARVLEQNGLWDNYVERVTGVSPSVAAEGSEADPGEAEPSEADPTMAEESGELSLLLPSDGETDSTGISDGADESELRTRLAMAEEDLEASRIENTELESRIAELQARLSKVEELQKMVEIEDDSLAQLQDDQAEEMVEEPVTSEPVSDEMQAEEEELLEELLAEEAAAQAQEEAIIEDTIADAEEFVDDTVASDDSLVDDAVVTEDTPEEMVSEEVTPPAPVIVTDPISRSPSIFDGILPPDIIDLIPSMPSLDSITGNPIVLGAIGGVVVLLLILVMIKRRKGSDDESDSVITVSEDVDDMFADDEAELTPIHLADADDTDIRVPSDENELAQAVEEPAAEEDFTNTSVISGTDMPEPEAPAPAAVSAEQDDVLNEVDVYLAYGLYDNAEDLLKSNLEENPDRAEYRSKLLDTYFATKNVDAFVNEAQTLKSMGDAGKRYWDRVQVMGYELTPDDPLFSDAKDSGLSAADLEITKPQEADFDLGASEDDDTNFSTTDFNLGEDDTGGDISETFVNTQIKPPGEDADELPSLDDDEDTNIRAELEEVKEDLPSAIGDGFELSDDDGDNADGEEAMDFELPEDLDLGSEGGEEDISEVDEDISEVDFGTDTFAVIPDDGADDMDIYKTDEVAEPGYEKTAIVDTPPGYEKTAIMDSANLDDAGTDSEIDLGMDDTALTPLVGSEGTNDDLVLELADSTDEDDEDISVINFGGDDFDAGTDIVDSVAMDVDVDDGDENTGTFAPGDFEEPTEAMKSISDIDDIGDLMLPDDVDEVSTKLDLARAFIDMGDTEGARGSLEEVISEGNDEQKAEAKELLDQI